MLIKHEHGNDLQTIKEHKLPRLVMMKPTKRSGRKSEDTSVLLNKALSEIAVLEARLQREREIRYQAGFQAGKRAGYKEGVAEINSQVQTLSSVIESFRAQQAEFIAGANNFIVEFAFKVVEKILDSAAVAKLSLGTEKITQLLDETVNRFPEAVGLVFRLHHDAAEVIEHNRDQIQEFLPDGVTFKINEDVSLKNCECLIECDYGALDARLDTQLEHIKNIFSDVRKQSRNI